MNNDMRHMDHIDDVASADCVCLREKERTYRGSWKKRGGVGASMMVLRKVDRLENMLVQRSYDMFRDAGDGSDGSMLAEIRDLRRYLLLVEAEMVARGTIGDTVFGEDLNRLGEIGEIGGPGTPEDGGHHARQVAESDGEVANSDWKMEVIERYARQLHECKSKRHPGPAPLTRRLEEGYSRKSDMPPVPCFEVRDPRASGNNHWLIARAALSAEELDHLPRLAVELNDKEHAETQAEYRGLYVWREEYLKWMMRDEYRLLWGKA